MGKKAGSAVVDLGMPLGNATRVTPHAASPSDSQVAGFSILQGESGKAITELSSSIPTSRLQELG